MVCGGRDSQISLDGIDTTEEEIQAAADAIAVEALGFEEIDGAACHALAVAALSAAARAKAKGVR